jgi:hypothetical protein
MELPIQSRADAALPRWVHWCDALSLVAAAIGVWIASFGAIIYRSDQLSLTARSPYRAWLVALILIALRHYRYPSPPLPVRIWMVTRQAVLALLPDAAVPDRRGVIQFAIATRVAIIAVGLLATAGIGYPEGPPPFGISKNAFLNLHARWDAARYAEIALFGYQWDPTAERGQSIAFFPGYPFLMTVAGNALSVAEYLVVSPGALGGPQARMVLGGVIVSLAAFALALLHLNALVRLFGDEGAARAAVTLLATYPYAVYFSAPLTESTFLLAAVAAFYSAEAQRFARMTFWSFLAGLVRPNGFVLTPALLLLVAQRMWSGRSVSGAPYPRRVVPFLGALGAAGAMFAFSWYVKGLTGDPFAWAHARSDGYPVAYPLDLLELVCVSLTLVLSVLCGRHGLAYAVWPLLSLVPSLVLDLPAHGRMTAVLFPAFVGLATFVSPRWHPAFFISFAVFQGFLAALFYTSRPPW